MNPTWFSNHAWLCNERHKYLVAPQGFVQFCLPFKWNEGLNGLTKPKMVHNNLDQTIPEYPVNPTWLSNFACLCREMNGVNFERQREWQRQKDVEATLLLCSRIRFIFMVAIKISRDQHLNCGLSTLVSSPDYWNTISEAWQSRIAPASYMWASKFLGRVTLSFRCLDRGIYV